MFGKRTQEEAEEIVAARGYELVSEYLGANDKIDIKCIDCDTISTLYWGNFNVLGHGCHVCAKENRRKNLRKPFDQIKYDFESKGFTMLSSSDDYINNRSGLRCICPCGNETVTQHRRVMKGGTCRKCGNNDRAKSQKIPFEQIKQEFEATGCILLSEPSDYINNKSTLKFQCVCGNVAKKTRQQFNNRDKCGVCNFSKKYENQRHSKKEVYDFVHARGLDIVVYDYKTSAIPLQLICKTCKFQFKMCLSSIKNNSGCPQCKCSSGEYKLLQFVKKITTIDWIREYRFTHNIDNGVVGCYNVKPLPFDMWIEPFNSHEMLIEIDGFQHFQPIDFYGGIDGFKNRRKCDIIKSLYCHNNNIPLLRIHYEDIDNLIEHVLAFMKKYKSNKDGNVLMYSDPEKYKDLIEEIDEASKK